MLGQRSLALRRAAPAIVHDGPLEAVLEPEISLTVVVQRQELGGRVRSAA